VASEREVAAMRRAIELANRGLGLNSPNPIVGCVILDAGGFAVGEGFFERPGEPHAEVHALRAAPAQRPLAAGVGVRDDAGDVAAPTGFTPRTPRSTGYVWSRLAPVRDARPRRSGAALRSSPSSPPTPRPHRSAPCSPPVP
jgi:diaminohydroxyphosphoribosylaminopyrimidine deaminase/5-amino-6-(5-phosphoribosylamino)uracil reductase